MKKSNSKICIIDDNEAVCSSLKFLLHSFGDFEVMTYHDPQLFLEDYSPGWTGCLLIDFLMPSLSGIELMKVLANRQNTMKIIMMSGHGTAETANQALKNGAYAFINKPFDITCLLEKINSIFQLVEGEKTEAV